MKLLKKITLLFIFALPSILLIAASFPLTAGWGGVDTGGVRLAAIAQIVLIGGLLWKSDRIFEEALFRYE